MTQPNRSGFALRRAAWLALLPLVGCANVAPGVIAAPVVVAPSVAVSGSAATPAAGTALQDRALASKPAWPPPAFPMPSAAEVASFAQAQRLAARNAVAAGQPVQAQRHWDVLLALQPSDAEALAGHAQASTALRAGAAERMARARAAQARGDTELAVRNYLEALAWEPEHSAAAEALRALEHQRALRNKPLSFARAPGARNPAGASAAGAGAEHGLAEDATELEHAALLASQGELNAAIALLTPLLRPETSSTRAAHPRQPSASTTKPAPQANDATVRANLADYHFMQAQRLASTDTTAARAALARCLRLAPQHPAAKALLAQLGAGQ